jgi:ankyrin repeat protein
MKKIISCFCLLLAVAGSAVFAFGGEIHQAVKKGDIKRVKSLLIQNPRLVSDIDEKNKIPMHLAAERGRVEILRLLIDIEPAGVYSRALDDITPLHLAARKGKAECVKLLLEHSAFSNARSRGGFTPLHFVALKGSRSGHVLAAKMLLDYGGDVNAETDRGSTPLGIAMRNRSKEIVALLKTYGAKLGSGRRDQRLASLDAKFDANVGANFDVEDEAEDELLNKED